MRAIISFLFFDKQNKQNKIRKRKRMVEGNATNNYLPELSQKTLIIGTVGGGGGGMMRMRDDDDGEKEEEEEKGDYKRQCFNVNDFQILAKQRLPKDLYEYLASGTDDEFTLNENRNAFQRWFLRPRVMKPVGKITTQTTLFGRTVSMPVFVSPAGVHALCCDDDLQQGGSSSSSSSGGGECTTIQACAKAGILFGLSQHSTRTIEDVANAVSATGVTVNKWYQAYILKDKNITRQLIRRAVNAGYNGIFVTVDSVRFGYREADARNKFNALPQPHRLANYDKYNDDNNDIGDDNANDTTTQQSFDQTTNKMIKFEQNVNWKDIEWIKEEAGNLPVVIKGIMTAEDAELAIHAGVDGIMVSNHGGRQLDGCYATIDVLPEISKVVAGRVPIWIDSGIRRGTDVLKALALGASAVGIGKPVFFALSVGGQDAVNYMLELLRTELEAAMAICGIEKIEDISPDLVSRHPSFIRSSL